MSKHQNELTLRRRSPQLLGSVIGIAACVLSSGCSSDKKGGDGGAGNGPVMQGPTPDVPVSYKAVTMHRLNRVEYSNTVRDLLGEPLALGATLPEDQVNSLGFDNDGTSLLTSPLLVNRWADLAEELVENYFARRSPVSQPFTNIVKPPCMGLKAGVDVCGTTNGGYYMDKAASGYWGMISAVQGLTVDQMTVPADGIYELSMKAFATPVISKGGGKATGNGQPYPVRVSVTVDGKSTVFDVTKSTEGSPLDVKVTLTLNRGAHALAISNMRNTEDPDNADGNWYNKSLWVGSIALKGPTSPLEAPDLMDCSTAGEGGTDAALDSDECVEHVLGSFVARAWRRPPTDDEIAALKALVTEVQASDTPGDSVAKTTEGIKVALRGALLSPHFVYRPEIDPDPASGAPRLLNGYELASRLSYFLWSTMPDDELFAAAADNSLGSKEVLEKQVIRMLTHEKAQAFIESFAGQWLQLRRMEGVSPDSKLFPKFSDDVRDGMLKETQSFFAEYLKPGNSFKDMLTADFTMLTPALGEFYGIKAGSGTEASRVSLAGTQRVGLLSQGSLLTLTSHANRTSPVLRGKFVLKQLLCSAPPPPPANVPPFNEDESAGSVRKRLEAHVKDAACNGCHKLMDPIGFSMENFDAVGMYRKDDGGKPIDTSGLALGDAPISDVPTLAEAIKNDSHFVPCVVQNMLSYALGHQIENTDGSGIAELAKASGDTNYELSSLIHIIVKSDAFLNHQGGNQ